MSTDEVYQKLTPVFHKVFEDDELVLRPGLTAADVDGWDSLSHIRLVLTVEKTFGFKFAASEIAMLKNVGELAHLIEAKTA